MASPRRCSSPYKGEPYSSEDEEEDGAAEDFEEEEDDGGAAEDEEEGDDGVVDENFVYKEEIGTPSPSLFLCLLLNT